MSERYGILIAQDGQAINSGRNKVDSRRKRWGVDLESNPPHQQIMELTSKTAFVDPGSSQATQQETLFSMKHKLGFTPLVLSYYYVLSVGGTTADSRVGGYSGDMYSFSGTSGTVNDAISYEVDTDELRIIHRFDSYGLSSGYTSNAPQFKMRVKFYIIPVNIGLALFQAMGAKL